jgi:hypothetical protein
MVPFSTLAPPLHAAAEFPGDDRDALELCVEDMAWDLLDRR